MWYRSLIFSAFFFVTVPLTGQQVYEKDQVDQAAGPIGGSLALNDFISHNVKAPFANSVENVKGRVEIKGIVEPDGSSSSLEITESLTPASDEEVLRLFRLFRAWKPALKDGKPVRQSFTYALQFVPASLEGFDPATYTYNFYYDKKLARIDDEKTAAFRMSVAVDSSGLPKPGLRLAEKKKNTWVEVENIADGWREAGEAELSSLLGVGRSKIGLYTGGEKVYVAKVGSFPLETGFPEYLVTADGRVVREMLPGVFTKVYYASGLVASVTIEEGDGGSRHITWYPNSVIKEKYSREKQADQSSLDKILHVYDSLGIQQVAGGNGEIVQGGHRWGKGRVEDGFQTGRWTDENPDGTPFFEEYYDKGTLTGGKRYAGGKVYEYEKVMVPPQFSGGTNAFYAFLAGNIRYPPEASRKRVQGRVILSFVVEPSGAVVDVEVKQSVSPELDAEAKRVLIKSSGKWEAGLNRGMPVRVRYTVPINFQLN